MKMSQSTDAVVEDGEDGKSLQKTQERPAWGEFHGAELDKDGKYLPPTEAEKTKHQKNLAAVGKIFDGANFYWSLDGASNISLFEGKQVRAHKDIDLSILSKDAVALAGHLHTRGYGIFVSYIENGKKMMRPFRDGDSGEKLDFLICKVDADGEVVQNGEANFFDLHIHHETASGDVRIAYNDAVLPREWFEARSATIEDGSKINISNPALVIYHKLNQGRNYDFIDSEIAAKHLKPEELAELVKIFQKEREDLSRQLDQVLLGIWEQMRTIYEFSSDPTVYAEALWSNPVIKPRKGEKNTEEKIQKLAVEVAESKPNLHSLREKFDELFHPYEKVDRKIEFLRTTVKK